MLSVDAHFHIWQLARGDYHWISAEQPRWYRDYSLHDWRSAREQISAGILVQCAPTQAETAFLLEQAARAEDVLGVVGWVNLLDSNAPDALATLAAEPKCVGIRPMLQDIADSDWILQDTALANLRCAADLGLRFDALVQPRHLPALLQLCDRVPDLDIVIDHAAKPAIDRGLDRHWQAHMTDLARHPQVYCKYSGLVTEAAADTARTALSPFIDVLLSTFGPQRLMWGSDWPVVRSRCEYHQWRQESQQLLSSLGEGDRRAIYSGNALRFYDTEVTR